VKTFLVLACCFGMLAGTATDALSYTMNKNRDKFSSKQREEIMAEGWKVCRQRYVLVERVVVADYAKRTYYCWHH